MSGLGSIGALGKISTRGERLDLELRQGASLLPVRHNLVDPDTGNPVDLTGFQARGQIRRKALDTGAPVASFNTLIAPTPTQGWYEFWLTDEQTSAITCGPTINDPASLYEWDFELQDAAGNVINTFWGVVRIAAEVTRA